MSAVLEGLGEYEEPENVLDEVLCITKGRTFCEIAEENQKYPVCEEPSHFFHYEERVVWPFD